PLVGVVERLARDLLGRRKAELGDLLADLAERLLGRLLDLAPRLLEPALAILLGLDADALALGVGNAARFGKDLLGLRLRLADQLPVLLEQLPRLFAGPVRLGDRLLDALTACVDRLLDRAERVLAQHEVRDPEADDRPDHQPGCDLDERIRG